MSEKGKKFSAGWFIFIGILALVLPGNAFADLSGSWSVNSSAPASGCHYNGTVSLIENDLTLAASATLAFQGSDCPSPATLSFELTRTTANGAITAPNGATSDDLSGSWSVQSTAPVNGCSFSGTANLIQNSSLLKGLINLSFRGIGCPAPITLPIHFTLLGSPVR